MHHYCAEWRPVPPYDADSSRHSAGRRGRGGPRGTARCAATLKTKTWRTGGRGGSDKARKTTEIIQNNNIGTEDRGNSAKQRQPRGAPRFEGDRGRQGNSKSARVRSGRDARDDGLHSGRDSRDSPARQPGAALCDFDPRVRQIVYAWRGLAVLKVGGERVREKSALAPSVDPAQSTGADRGIGGRKP